MISRVIQGGETIMTQPFHYKDEWKDGQFYDYYHGGVDLVGANYAWSPPNCLAWIVAHSNGIVVDVRTDCQGFEQNSYGNYVLLRHNNGYCTMYAHLAYGFVEVSMGQTVKKGQVLGYMDNTGTSYGGHLHWEVRTPSGECIDPEPYLNAELPGIIPPLKVNGSWNKGTTKRLQYIFGAKTKKGLVTNQILAFKPKCPACNAVTSWRFVKKPTKGDALIKAMQKWFGLKQTGWVDDKFILALQKKCKVPQTGKIDKPTVKQIQRWINKKLA